MAAAWIKVKKDHNIFGKMAKIAVKIKYCDILDFLIMAR